MSRIPRFAAYAAAFEQAYASDDWSQLEPFFTENAVYETGLGPPFGGEVRGRAALLAYCAGIVARFDRRFASRELSLLEGPRADGDTVWTRGVATYRAAGVPDLVLELEESVAFEGDRIARLSDRYSPEMERALFAYLKEHGGRLGIESV